MEKMKKSIEAVDQELKSVNMPLVNKFREAILKQKEIEFRRTARTKVERVFFKDNVLPHLIRSIERERTIKEKVEEKRKSSIPKIKMMVRMRGLQKEA